MKDDRENFGDLCYRDGYITATMERRVDNSVDEIWQFLSEESKRVMWLAPGEIELQRGGRARLDFKDSYVIVDSEVTACDAPVLLEFSWSDRDQPLRPIRFEIEDHGSDRLIRLRVSIPEDEVVPRSCAGWEAHLTMLQAALAGVSTRFPLERFKACRAHFEDDLAALIMREVPIVRL